MGYTTLNDFRSWVNKIGKHAGLENVEYVEDDIDQVRVRVYTDNNSYAIIAKSNSSCQLEGGYLGCIASSRKPRAGEDWTRGSDLADGKLNLDTWNKILSDIVAYELVKVHKP